MFGLLAYKALEIERIEKDDSLPSTIKEID